jgi:hypothetical protein
MTRVPVHVQHGGASLISSASTRTIPTSACPWMELTCLDAAERALSTHACDLTIAAPVPIMQPAAQHPPRVPIARRSCMALSLPPTLVSLTFTPTPPLLSVPAVLPIEWQAAKDDEAMPMWEADWEDENVADDFAGRLKQELDGARMKD